MEIADILAFMSRGGVVMWPIFGVSLVAFYLVAMKGFLIYGHVFRYKKSDPLQLVLAPLKKGDFSEVKRRIRDHGPSEKIILKGVAYIERGHSDETIKDRLAAVYEEELGQLEDGLNTILVLGEILPMLGLLGTVSGMIQVFNAISAHGTENAAAMASGISQALITTELGLVLGIPTLLLYALLNGKVDVLAKNMRHSAAILLSIKRTKLDVRK